MRVIAGLLSERSGSSGFDTMIKTSELPTSVERGCYSAFATPVAGHVQMLDMACWLQISAGGRG